MMQIYCKNTKTTKSFPEGTSLLEMLPYFEFDNYNKVFKNALNLMRKMKEKVTKEMKESEAVDAVIEESNVNNDSEN